MDFKLVSDYKPAGDQARAIDELTRALSGVWLGVSQNCWRRSALQFFPPFRKSGERQTTRSL